MHCPGSSLRAEAVDVTLRRAELMGARLGITRVTEITRLDRIGIPVCVGIRPGALPGSLCVSAGKGLTSSEARASAWMEAIEFAMAEPGIAGIEIVAGTARALPDGRDRADAVLDFCPRIGATVELDAPMPCVAAEELLSGGTCLVPAEMIFLPDDPRAPAHYFNGGTNGLASGNTRLEATVHGLAEVIERDICTFHLVRDRSVLVREETLPPFAARLACAIYAAGLRLTVRYLPGEFGIPCFRAVIADPDYPTPLFVNGGYGCHPHRDIALARALCEAAQSRLSVIHGSRDDLTDFEARFGAMSDAQRADHLSRLLAGLASPANAVAYQETADLSEQATDLQTTFTALSTAVQRAGLRRICRVSYTAADQELQVVKILVPGLEHYNVSCPFAGPRIAAFASAL